jgi:simple sugar transport system substrate-binding protein
MSFKRVTGLLLVVLVLGLLAGCGGTTPTDVEKQDTAVVETPVEATAVPQVVTEPVAQNAGAAPGAGARHICAIGGADQFFSVVKNGADLAGALVTKAGSEYTWIPLPNYDNIGPDMAKLEEQAIAQGCTALAVPVWDGPAQAPALADAVAAGINVFMYNSGLPLLQDGTIKALAYFGTDEYEAGLTAGKYFVEHGSKNVRCVNTQPGAVNWQQRCGGLIEGAKQAGGTGDEIILPAEDFGNASAIAAAVQAALAKDPTIDGFATGAAADADAVNEGLKVMGATAQQGGWDVSATILDRISNGEALFAVDQQGWLQGWLAVSQAWLYDQFAMIPATNVILTGPALITKDNVDVVKAGVADGWR